MAEKDTKTPLLSNTAYDVAKDVTTLYLPALGTFYAAVAAIWGLPFPNEVVGTIAALVTLLGVILKVSTKQYDNSDAKFDGTFEVSDDVDPEEALHRLSFNDEVEDLADRDQITLRIKKPQQ